MCIVEQRLCSCKLKIIAALTQFYVAKQRIKTLIGCTTVSKEKPRLPNDKFLITLPSSPGY